MTLLEVGRITKAFGVKGEVLVALTTDRVERLDPGSVLQTDRGDLTVVRAAPHQDRWIVLFEGLRERNGAEALRGTLLRAEPLDGHDDVLWVHELIGSTVVLADGTAVGTVEFVQDNPASDLLVLDTGALVPIVFITDNAGGRITIDPPEGLLEVNEPD